MDDPQSRFWSPDTLMKAWDDYVSTTQVMLERLANERLANTAHTVHTAHAAMNLPFFGAWQEFAAALGARSSIEEMMANFSPKLGLTREYQGILQRMAEIGTQFQQRHAEFLKLGADIGEQAFQSMQKRASADPGLANSPSAAYEAWIDSAETAYSQAAHGEPFARALGELCNLLSALKIERGKLLEALARHLDLPTRAEVDSLHRQVHQLRAAMRGTARTRPKPRNARKRTKK
jgi:class III poly(R)-hydroxyalkanoic acid synthase PhaE subunit